MLASSSLDASICLRCHLRLLLRKTTARSPHLLQQRRHESTNTTEYGKNTIEHGESGDGHDTAQNDSQYPVTKVWRGGKRKKDRQERYRATTARLPIASLNKETEVIVLRDLPKRKSAPRITIPKEPEQSEDTPAQHVKPPLTAGDIELLSDKHKQSLTQDEVFASIDSARFAEDDVVTSAQYEAKLKELVNAYNINQLRRYQQRDCFRERLHPVAPRPESSSVPSGGTAAMVLKYHVKTTPWTPVLPQKPLKSPKAAKPAKGQGPSSRYLVAETIVRKCWGVKVEEELAMSGQIDLKLLPEQYHLWTNSIPEAHKTVQPSSRFYKNSNLVLLQKQRMIRIEGPKSEAEAMAATVRDAFRTAEYASIELERLKGLYSGKGNFEKDLGSSQLKRIMDLTNSSVAYLPEKNVVKFASFNKEGVHDAMRLVLSLLPLPTRTTVSYVTPEIASSQCHLSPSPNNTIRPYRYRHDQLGRVTKHVSNTDSAAETPSQPSHDGVMKTVLDILSTVTPPAPHGSLRTRSLWDSSAVYSNWTASIGQILRPTSSPSPVALEDVSNSSKAEGKASNFTPQEHLSNQIFAPNFPTNLFLLSQLGSLDRARGSLRDEITGGYPRQLIAKLIPSPITDIGLAASRLLPEIGLVFKENRNAATRLQQNPANPTEDEEFLDHTEDEKADEATNAGPNNPSSSVLRWTGMEATLEHQVIDVPLPHQPIDLRFERKLTLQTNISKDVPLRDGDLQHYINSIITSAANADEGAVRAGRSIPIKIPGWALRPLPNPAGSDEEAQHLRQVQECLVEAAAKTTNKEVAFEYLFSGFEYRECRDMSMLPVDVSLDISRNHVLRVEQVEGGQMFGKGMQASILPLEASILPHRGRRARLSRWMRSQEADLVQPEVDTLRPGVDTLQPGVDTPQPELGLPSPAGQEMYRPFAPVHFNANEGAEQSEKRESNAQDDSLNSAYSPFELVRAEFEKQDAPKLSTENAAESPKEEEPKLSLPLPLEEELVKTAFSMADLVGELQRREKKEIRVRPPKEWPLREPPGRKHVSLRIGWKWEKQLKDNEDAAHAAKLRRGEGGRISGGSEGMEDAAPRYEQSPDEGRSAITTVDESEKVVHEV